MEIWIPGYWDLAGNKYDIDENQELGNAFDKSYDLSPDVFLEQKWNWKIQETKDAWTYFFWHLEVPLE